MEVVDINVNINKFNKCFNLGLSIIGLVVSIVLLLGLYIVIFGSPSAGLKILLFAFFISLVLVPIISFILTLYDCVRAHM